VSNRGADPLEVIDRYQATRARLVSGEREASRSGPGGGLAAAVERLGLGPLVGLLHELSDLDSLALEDGDVTLALERDGDSARMVVAWASGEQLEERLALEAWPEAPAAPGFTPDPDSEVEDLWVALADLERPLYAVASGAGTRFYTDGAHGRGAGASALLGWVPPAGPPGPAWLRHALGVRANYIAGAMAGGISSAEMVIAMGRAGYLAFFGAGGLPLEEVEAALEEVSGALGETPYGFNLLHNPAEPAVEECTVDLYLKHGCRMVSASAYMGLTEAVVRYRYSGVRRDDAGRVLCPNRVFAKVSRPEVAAHFLRPAPEDLLRRLVARGRLEAEEAELARQVPMADAITAEADSAGHTDGRPLPVVLPLLRAQRDAMASELGYAREGFRVAVGAAGGLGTPSAVAGAFAMGADYVLTGSINQAAREAGTSPEVKRLLAQAGIADVARGPAPDMFELGAQVQVLSRGTMYAQRARRLYDTYKSHGDWSEVPPADRNRIEKRILRRSFESVWVDCVSYWRQRDPTRLARAERDGRLRMALVFRWYLGMTSRWARAGEGARKRDYQVWCGPSMGAFNDWARGGPLAPIEARGVVEIADALLVGAAAIARAARLRAQGVTLPD